jgi:hypothetical protein
MGKYFYNEKQRRSYSSNFIQTEAAAAATRQNIQKKHRKK